VSKGLVLAIVGLAVVGWMGLGASGFAGAAAAPAAHASAPAAVSPASAAAPAVSTAPANIASSMAEHALAATKAAGLKPNVVFVPRPSASPAQEAAARTGNLVSPLYNGTPAPIGLAYYGLSGIGTGPPVATVLQTDGVMGIVSANATGIQGMDLFQSSPDSFGIQLNAVVTNVTLFGHPGYQFWTQNVVEFYPTAHFMVLITNVWNFSGGAYNGNEFYAHGPDGTNFYGALGYYYAETVVPYPVAYPFNLILTMNSTVASGRNNISFGVDLTSATYPGEDFAADGWDYVTFNSTTAVDPHPISSPTPYTADGTTYNPIGLTNDFELDICGPGGGSQVDLSAADATLGLAYLLNGTYVSVPAAYNYGGETGETATGANVAWSNTVGGPGSLGTYGTMTTGPAVMSGLWGTGAPEGSYAVTLDETPANAFNFFQYNGTLLFQTPIVFEPNYAPSMLTTTFYLMPGTYDLLTELSDFSPHTTVLTVTSTTVVSLSLAPNPALGVYTPLWAFNNAELATLATSGAGTAASPYQLPNTQTAPFSANFGLYNDFTFPVFPGVFLFGTTASVELYKPASFAADTNNLAFPGPYLPAVNDLQYWFWNASGVSIVDAANISGWFGQNAYYPVVFDTFSVIFYEGGHNLVAGNTFDSEGQGLLMFSGGTLFGPLNVGGGNNTVWGNHFLQAPAPAGSCPESPVCLGLMGFGEGLGIEIAEDHDLVYNNYVAAPTTAWLLPLNLYSGDPEFFTHDRWNVTPQPATNVNFASGFPGVPLTGSIVGSVMQGGNFWWDYGLFSNPYNGAYNPIGALPYQENATTLILYVYGPSYYYLTYIYPGGDFAPLTTVGYSVSAHETGALLPGTAWGIEIFQGDLVFGFYEGTASSVSFGVFPIGVYHWVPLVPVGYSSVAGGSFHIAHRNVNVGVPFHLARGYAFLTFHEAGLPHGTPWSVTLNGTTIATDAFNTTVNMTGPSGKIVVVDGTYDFSVPGVPGYTPSPSSGALAIVGSTTLHIRFHLFTFSLVFSETGVPAGRHWSVRITGPITGGRTVSRTMSTTGSSLSFSVPNGTYSYTVNTPTGTSCTPSSGSQSISGAGVSIPLSCTSGGGSPTPGGAVPGLQPASAARLAAARGI